MQRGRRTGLVFLLATVVAVGTSWADEQETPAVLPRDADKELLSALGESFEIHPTKHFLIYCNTTRVFTLNRALLFEKLYEVYDETLEQIGLKLRTSGGRLTVLLFEDGQAFRKYLGGEVPPGVGGVYMQDRNQIVFFDANSDPEYLETKAILSAVSEELRGIRRVITGIRHPTAKLRYTRIIGKYQQEIKSYEDKLEGLIANSNVAVTIHEATHALSFNLGPFDLASRPPRWLAEGMATFFETPRVGRWRGAARFNAPRFIAYREAKKDGKLPPLSAIVTNEKLLMQGETVEAAYGASWSLFYFLYHQHPSGCAEMLQTLRVPTEPPADDAEKTSRAEALTRSFETTVGQPLDVVETEWHTYMLSCAEEFARDIEGWERSVNP
ncbi:MAG: DUF1570 domain-containing protein [Planctomycetota bacterium]